MSSVFSQDAKARIPGIISRYPEKRAAMLPLLWIAQEEHGYVSEEAMQEIASLLNLTPPQVYETVTFYTMYNLKPPAKYHIQVCRSLMCALVGAGDVLRWIDAKAHLKSGATSSDGMFRLSQVECLGSCATAPMMQINDNYYEQLTQDKIDQILDDLKRNGTSTLVSGPYLVTPEHS